MKFFIATLVLVSSVAFGSEVSFNCKSVDGGVKLRGVLENAETAKVKIYDQQNQLGVKELAVGESVEFQRSLRKKEAQYSFAKMYSDFNPWQDIEISIPKTVLEQGSTGAFSAFITIFSDDGDRMVPGESLKLSCQTK